MKNKLEKKLKKFITALTVVILTINGDIISAEEVNKALPQLDKGANTFKNDLIPMPTGDIQSALSKVNTQRNPFQNPSKSEIENINDLNSTLKFKGLAKSGDKLKAIIESESIQKFYEVGDTLDNGFLIKAISLEDISVDVSNGSKNYRLILNNIKQTL